MAAATTHGGANIDGSARPGPEGGGDGPADKESADKESADKEPVDKEPVDMVHSTVGRGLDAELGLYIDEVGPDGIVAGFEITARHHQPFGIVHGGVYCAVGESVASMSGFNWLHHSGIGGTAVGVNNNTDFLRSVSAGTVTARSTPVHRGRRQQLWVVEMTDERGRLLAKSQVRLQNIEMPAPDASAT